MGVGQVQSYADGVRFGCPPATLFGPPPAALPGGPRWRQADALAEKHGDHATVFLPCHTGKATYRGQWAGGLKEGYGEQVPPSLPTPDPSPRRKAPWGCYYGFLSGTSMTFIQSFPSCQIIAPLGGWGKQFG